jgi:mannose-6-phosphate isomerase-like protein (cupin superfamily)
MSREPVIIDRQEWSRESDPNVWRGRLEGERLGADVTILFFSTNIVGHGPVLHVHPYGEIFIVRQGKALFTVGERKLEACAGQIVFGPAGVPHKFINIGPGTLETTDIHLGPKFIQTDLHDPELQGSPETQSSFA